MAWHFVGRLSAGSEIYLQQWYFRPSAKPAEINLPQRPEVVHQLSQIRPDADLYLLAIKDDAVSEVSAGLTQLHGNQHITVAHMSGALEPEALHQEIVNRAVCYPLQTFTAGRPIDLSSVPFFLCTESEIAAQHINLLCDRLKVRVSQVSAEQKLHLHLAAVMVNNFTNHWLALGYDYLEKHGLDKENLEPLIRETLTKALETHPADAQSGPARRMDKSVLNKHLQLLGDNPELSELYRLMSRSIYHFNNRRQDSEK